ncbi:MAG: aminotransferase class V-fold PLP-dependent enzyme [Nitrososphaerales archaeon]|nr:aminotransferase class V-fold PLP-dependent enzyme [Nitrososphaerales archaeon]
MLESGTLELEKVRSDFPILKRKVHGKRLVYLDNAATTQKPKQVIDALVDYYSRYNSNVHRSVHTLGEEATEAYEGARGKTAAFVGCKPAEVVFTRGTTESINLVRFAWGESGVGRGDTIVTTLMEHHSNIVPWQLLAKKKGANLKFVGLNSDGTLNIEEFEKLMGSSPAVVALTQCSNVLGTINDVAALCSKARKAGAVTVVDAAQSVPHMPVDVSVLGCDFLAFSVTGDTPVLIESAGKIQLVPIEEAVELYNRGKDLSILTLGTDAKAKFERVNGALTHLDRIYEVSYENSALPVRATGYHSVYVWRDGDIVDEQVSKLRKGDFLVTLNRQSRTGLGDSREFPLEFTHHGNLTRENVEITGELMRLVGYYLAEGSVDPRDNRVSLTFGEDETTFVNDARVLIESLEPIHYYSNAFEKVKVAHGASMMQIATTAGISRKTATKYSGRTQPVGVAGSEKIASHLWYNHNNHTTNISFNNKKWFEFFKSSCGTSINKHLPDFVWRVRAELVAELLKGYLRGDGSKNEDYRIVAKSVSKRLISELSWLLKLHGISNTLGFAKSRRRTWNSQYSLVIQRSELVQLREFYRPLLKRDASRDKSLCVDALKEAYRLTKPRHNSEVSSTLRSVRKRASRKAILEVVRWIESTHKGLIEDRAQTILARYKQFANGDFGVVKVRDVRAVGEHTVYDVSVPGSERFFGGFYPILLHNSGHKMLGPTGIGVLFGRKELLQAMEPFHGGGEMIREVFLDHATWNDVPYKFEAGTVNIADAIGLGAAIDYLSSIGMKNVREHEVKLLKYALDVLGKVKGFEPYGPSDVRQRGGVVSFNLADVHPHDLATILDEEGIAIRSGHHCAQPLMRWLNVAATSRASFYIYNSYDDVDSLRDGLEKARKVFKL